MSNRADCTVLATLFPGRTDRIGLMTEAGPISRTIDPKKLFVHLDNHTRGIERCGIYNVLPDDTVRFAVLDFDSHGASDPITLEAMEKLSIRYQSFLRERHISCYREISKSGRGNYHIWIPFERPLPAARVRMAMQVLVQRVGNVNGNSGIEIFPKQDQLNGRIGNFIWLPYFGRDEGGDRTVFLEPGGTRSVVEVRQNSLEHFEALVNELQKANGGDGNLDRIAPQAVDASTRKPHVVELLRADEILEGQRHDSLTRIVGHWKRRSICQEETLMLANLWNKRLRNPLPVEEVESTIRSLYKSLASDAVPGFELCNGLEALDMQIESPAFLVEDLIRETSLNMLFGEPECGKSMLALNLSLAVATGAQDWLAYKLNKQGKVLYVNNEVALEDFIWRIKAMASEIDPKEALKNLIFPKVLPEGEQFWHHLDEVVSEERPALLVVDTFYMLHQAEENDSSDMKPILKKFLALRDEYKMAVLLIHHTKKGSHFSKMHNEQMRGSSVFGAMPDTVLQMKRSGSDDTKRYLKPTKLRHSSDLARVCRQLGFDAETLWFTDEGEIAEGDQQPPKQPARAIERISTQDVFRGNGVLQAKEIVARVRSLGYSGKTTQRLLERWISDGLVEKVE
ncbi:MAG: AAA family ATPase, partial [Bacteroidota bacterium]